MAEKKERNAEMAKLRAGGWPLKALAAHFGIGITTVSLILFRLRHPIQRADYAQTSWPAADLARLRVLWAAELSTQAIGREMGRSKNAVVGKAHRLGLPARPSPILSKGQPKPVRPAVTGIVTLPRLPSVAPGAVAAPLPPTAVAAPSRAVQAPVVAWPRVLAAQPIVRPRQETARTVHAPPAPSARSDWSRPPQPAPAALDWRAVGWPAPDDPAWCERLGFRPAWLCERLPDPGEARGCRWPLSETGAARFEFCGQEIEGRSYCGEHARVAFNTAPMRARGAVP
jgi:GcrA cell cycle regulator